MSTWPLDVAPEQVHGLDAEPSSTRNACQQPGVYEMTLCGEMRLCSEALKATAPEEMGATLL